MNLFRNRTLIGILCIILSLIICFIVAPFYNQNLSQRIKVVRVTREIRTGEQIAADMVTLTEVGGYNLPDGAIRSIDTVVGKYAIADLVAGDYIMSAKLSDSRAAENAYLYNLDGTRQAMSVTIRAFANGLSGKLQSGDIVNVIAADYRKLGETIIPDELQFVEVISVTASSGYDANTGQPQNSEEGDERELPSTVTLLVTSRQSRILGELEADGHLHISLVYRGTAESAAIYIQAQDDIIAELIAAEEAELEEIDDNDEVGDVDDNGDGEDSTNNGEAEAVEYADQLDSNTFIDEQESVDSIAADGGIG